MTDYSCLTNREIDILVCRHMPPRYDESGSWRYAIEWVNERMIPYRFYASADGKGYGRVAFYPTIDANMTEVVKREIENRGWLWGNSYGTDDRDNIIPVDSSQSRKHVHRFAILTLADGTLSPLSAPLQNRGIFIAWNDNELRACCEAFLMVVETVEKENNTDEGGKQA